MTTKLHLRIYDIKGKKTKNNKKITVTENRMLDSMVLSSVTLRPEQKTKKEFTTSEEKIIFFLSGNATVYMNDEIFTVQANDVLLLPLGTEYMIENYSSIDLVYTIVSSITTYNN